MDVMRRPHLLRTLLTTVLLAVACAAPASAAPDSDGPCAFRGYYITFMRMPVYGLAEWKSTVDTFHRDGVNVLILWTAGSAGLLRVN